MEIFTSKNLEKPAKILSKGGLIAFPTETVFGLGVVYDNSESYKRLIDVKRRNPDKPFTLMLADVCDLEKYIEMNDIVKTIVEKFMPGQITIVTKAKDGLPEWCVGVTGNIGVRIPNHEIIRDLIRKTGKPLLVPSANKSGENPANSVKEVIEIFGEEIDGVIEGSSTSKIPSSVVIINNDNVIMAREGVITLNEINKVIGRN